MSLILPALFKLKAVVTKGVKYSTFLIIHELEMKTALGEAL